MSVFSKLGGAAKLAGLGLLGWLAYSRLAVPHDLPLPPALDAGREDFELSGFGRLAVYADRSGTGRPLLLLHSVNAAASSAEMRPLFGRFRGERPVFALDWPGFGLSARPDVRYTPELFARAARALLERTGEADVVALSLGSEFAARAALEGAGVRSLALISPSGLGTPRGGTQRANAEGGAERLHRRLAFPLWAQALYDLIVTRPSIVYFLKQSFVGPVDERLADYGYLSGHRPGARYAPLYFLSGSLFDRNAFEKLYARLDVPTLALYDQDAFVNFDRLPELVSQNGNVRAERIPETRGLPQFDAPDKTAAALERFWPQVGTPDFQKA